MSLNLKTLSGPIDFTARMPYPVLEALGRLSSDRIIVRGVRDPAATGIEIIRSNSTAAGITTAYMMPAQPGVAVITHANAADRGNGTGAQQVEIEGVTLDGSLVRRTIDLATGAGATTDTDGPEFVYIHKIRVTRVGSGGANAAAIHAEPFGTTLTFGACSVAAAAEMVSAQCVALVPPGRVGIIDAAEFLTDGTNAEVFSIYARRFIGRDETTGQLTADGNGNATAATGVAIAEYTARTSSGIVLGGPPIIVPPDTLILGTHSGSASAGGIQGRIGLTLVPVEVLDEVGAAVGP